MCKNVEEKVDELDIRMAVLEENLECVEKSLKHIIEVVEKLEKMMR